MQNSRKTSLLILSLYLFSIFSPLTAYAQPSGSAAAVQAAAEALSMNGEGNGVGFPGDGDADTGINGESDATMDFPHIEDQASTEPIFVDDSQR